MLFALKSPSLLFYSPLCCWPSKWFRSPHIPSGPPSARLNVSDGLLHLWSGTEVEGGGLCSTKIELEPGEAEDGDLMTDAIINYSKYQIMVLHDAVACAHTHRKGCCCFIVCQHHCLQTQWTQTPELLPGGWKRPSTSRVVISIHVCLDLRNVWNDR